MDALFRTEVAHDALIREAQRALAHLVTISLHSAERSADRWRAVVAADYSNIDMEPPQDVSRFASVRLRVHAVQSNACAHAVFLNPRIIVTSAF